MRLPQHRRQRLHSSRQKHRSPRFPLRQRPPTALTHTTPISIPITSTRKNTSTMPRAISSARPPPSPPPLGRTPSGLTAASTTKSPALSWWSGAVPVSAPRCTTCTKTATRSVSWAARMNYLKNYPRPQRGRRPAQTPLVRLSTRPSMRFRRKTAPLPITSRTPHRLPT